VRSSAFKTHTLPPPITTLLGVVPVAVYELTPPFAASIAATALSDRFGSDGRVIATPTAIAAPASRSTPAASRRRLPTDESAAAAKTRRLEADGGRRGLDEYGGALVSLLLLLGERLPEDGVEVEARGESRRVLLHVRPQELRLRGAVERRLPGQALVQDACECVHIRAPVDLLSPDLLGGEVVEGADQLPGFGRGASHLLGEPEVRQVRLAGYRPGARSPA
jgi:hypothetical protein